MAAARTPLRGREHDLSVASSRLNPTPASLTPRGSVSGSETRSPSIPAGAAARDAEARCSSIIADTALRSLDERQRAEERERMLREDLHRERSRNAELSSKLEGLPDRVAKLQTAAGATPGRDGDLVSEALRTLSDFEAVVRKQETDATNRIADAMESFHADWLTKTREFDQQKTQFEHDVIGRAQDALRRHDADVRKRDSELQDRMIAVLRQQSEARLAQEQTLLGRLEGFKAEYKAVQDRDFDTRCQLFDKALEVRQRDLLDAVQRERQQLRLQEARLREMAAEHQKLAHNEATDAVVALRAEMAGEATRRQSELRQELNQQREETHREIARIEQEKSDELASMHQQTLSAISNAQQSISRMEEQMREKEAELQQRYSEDLRRRNQERDAEHAAHKAALERRYFEQVEQLRSEHAKELKRMETELTSKRDEGSAECFRREQEMRLGYESKQRSYEDKLQQKYHTRLQDSQDAEAALREQLGQSRREVADLEAQQRQLTLTLQARDHQHEANVVKVQREAELIRSALEAELKVRYDQWLADAMGDLHRQTLERAEHERALSELSRASDRYKAVLEAERQAWEAERAQLKEAIEAMGRGESDRAKRHEEELLRQAAEMRVELEAEAKRREAETERQLTSERRRLWDEVTECTVQEKRERAEFEERVREEEQGRWRGLLAEAESRADNRATAALQAIAVREADLDSRESALRQEQARLMAQLQEQHHLRAQEIHQQAAQQEAELRATLQQEMRTERERLQAELAAIRRRAEDEQRRAEEQRAALQRQVQEARAEAAEEARKRFEGLTARLQDEHSSVLAVREDAAEERLRQASDRSAREIEQLRKDHQDYCARLRLEHSEDRARADRQAEEARRGMDEELAAARRACVDLRSQLQKELEDQRLRAAAEAEQRAREHQAEVARLEGQRDESERRLRADFRVREEQLRSEAAAGVAAEKDKAQRLEKELAAGLDRSRIEIEAAARRDAQAFVDSQQKQFDALLDERRKRDDVAHEKLRAEMLAREEALTAKQRGLEDDTRQRIDQAIRDAIQQRDEDAAHELVRTREEVASLRQQLALAARHAGAAAPADSDSIASAAVAAAAGSQFGELRAALEKGHTEELRRRDERHEALLRSTNRAAEEKLDRQSRLQQTELEGVRQRARKERDDLQARLDKKDAELAQRLQAVAEEGAQRLQRQLQDLREVYERRLRERDEVDREKATAAERQKCEYEARIRSHYEDLLREQEGKAHEAREEREAVRAAQDRERERQVSLLRQEIDTARMSEESRVEDQVRERLRDSTRLLEEEKSAMALQLAEERRLRMRAEAERDTAAEELSSMKQSMVQWKQELSDSLVAKYEGLFSEVQGRARKEREAFARKVLEDQERRLARELVRKDHELRRARDTDEQAAAQEVEDKSRRLREFEQEQRERRTADALVKRHGRLLHLWQALSTDPDERVPLLDAVLRRVAVPDGPDGNSRARMGDVLSGVLDELTTEVRRMEAKLPLMDLITRREFLKARLSEARQGAAAGGPSIQDLVGELRRVDEQLLADLPTYQQQFQARIVYDGKPYLQLMQRELGVSVMHANTNAP